MTTYADLGIDEATFITSLRVIGHPWRPGQRCERIGCGQWTPVAGDNGYWQHEHEVPIPAVTDELLMRMLRETLQRKTRLWEWWKSIWIDYWTYKSLEAAIIRATAALDKEG